jgi:O-antigen/teichoic acid export membrane protein
MSVVKRVLSGSAAAWSKIIVTLFGQLALVPIFLSHWTVEQYGCWLILQSITGLSTVLSFGHQNFVGFEFLKCGKDKTDQLALIFYSSIPYGIFIGIIELLIVLGVIYFGGIVAIFDPEHKLSQELIHETTYASIVQSATWLLISSVGGLAGRLLAPIGHYPRNAWWGVLGAFISMIASVLAVFWGAGILLTTVAVAVVTILYNIPLYYDFWKIFKINGLHPVKPDWKLGFNNAVRSFAIAINTFLDILRQQGLRVFLSSLVGVKEMTAFSTMRTASNVTLQGVGTIVNPILPELMRFLKNRDQERGDATLAFVWFFTVILLAPVLVILQGIMPDLFALWTRSKIEYDPLVFGLFSIVLIIYAVSQPASAILQGNNQLKQQLFITILVSLISVLGVIFVSPILGIRGAAIVLVISEFFGCFALIIFANNWLKKNYMHWPWSLFLLTLISAFLDIFWILLLINQSIFNDKIIIFSIISNIIIAVFFIRKMPTIAILRLKNLLRIS